MFEGLFLVLGPLARDVTVVEPLSFALETTTNNLLHIWTEWEKVALLWWGPHEYAPGDLAALGGEP
jgi:hypothetical protein